jgi:hypothetical protein
MDSMVCPECDLWYCPDCWFQYDDEHYPSSNYLEDYRDWDIGMTIHYTLRAPGGYFLPWSACDDCRFPAVYGEAFFVT